MKGISQVDALEIIKKLDNIGEAAIDLKNTFVKLALASKLAAIELRRLGIAWKINP